MKKSRNELKKELNNALDRVIDYFQILAIILGVILLALAAFIDKDCIILDISGIVLSQIGGTFLSMGCLGIFYEKWKNIKKDNKQYFLMGPASYQGSGQNLEEIANIDKETAKIILIGSMSEGKLKEEYSFITLLNGDNLKLLQKDKPVFSYGTSFHYLESKESDYYKAFEGAIKEGIGLNVSIMYPEINVAEIKDIEGAIGRSKDTLRSFKNMISTFITKEKKTNFRNPIELRLSRYFSPCSFSSLEFCSGRTIRTLDFNFLQEGSDLVKMSQVHDNPPGNKDHDHTLFSEHLYKRYERLYKESMLALRYPMEKDITYYVLGIIVDVDESNKQKKLALFNGDSEWIKIVVHLEATNNTENQFKLSVKTNDNEYQDYNNEISSNYVTELSNTVIGNVFIGYKKLTGCVLNPNRSFEIDNNTFLLLGRIVNRQDNLAQFKQIDFADTINSIDNKLGDISLDSSKVRKIKSIVNMM